MKLNSDIADYAKERETWRHVLVSQRYQTDFALCPPVQEDIAVARFKPLSQREGSSSLFGKGISY